MGGNLRDLEAVMGVEYIRRKENKMNGEKEIAQMGREEAFSCFISLSLGSRKRESHPITGGHQTRKWGPPPFFRFPPGPPQ